MRYGSWETTENDVEFLKTKIQNLKRFILIRIRNFKYLPLNSYSGNNLFSNIYHFFVYLAKF